MIQITADTRRAVVTNKELLTVGSAGIQVQFTLSEDWDTLSKLAVFRVGDDGTKVDVVLGESLTCVVPPEVLTQEDEVLFIGIYGANGQGTVIIPTVWASAGVVKPGTEPETPASATPTPEIWAQILSVANDAEQTATEAMSIVGAGLQDLSTLEGNVEAAEAQRVVNEQDRAAAEQQRVLAENNREAAENTRASTETVRVNAETSRVTAEAGRVSAENARVSAEAARVTAEEGRVAAEENREAHYAEYVTTVQGYANAASASATSAAGSATDAASSASSASTSAGQAASSASSASTSASQASNSASNASASATTASNAATTATTQAGIATTKAGEAASSATTASTSAASAAAAQAEAEAAQRAAEAAAEYIEESAAQIAQNTQDISDAKNAIEQKAPVIINTASGDIASCADGADGMPIKHLVANIEPVQSGTGDPSPDNVRPITGWTGLTGARNSGNLLDANGYIITTEVGTDKTIITNKFAYLLAGKTYTFSCRQVANAGSVVRNLIGVANDTSQVALAWETTNTGDAHIHKITFTPTNSGYYKPLYWAHTLQNSVTLDEWQVNVGTEVQGYELYQNTSISISWQSEAGTVYGGTLDVVTGELTVDAVSEEFTFDNVSTLGGFDSKIFNLSRTSTNGNLSDGKKTNVVNDYAYGGTTVNRPHFYVADNSCVMYLAENTYRGGNIQVVYPLATPIVYHLDPVTVNTLLGNNTIYVDCGSVTVDYPADTGIVVAQQSNAIDQLESEVVTDVTVTGTDVTIVAQANKRYLCGTVSTIAVTPCATGAFDLIFTSGSSAAILTIPSTVKWQDSFFDPTALDTDTIYEISVADGTLGLVAKWT